MPNTMRDLEQRVRDLDRRLDELLGFVVAVALSPTGCVSDDLCRRALELTDLFDATVEITTVEPDGQQETREQGWLRPARSEGVRYGDGTATKVTADSDPPSLLASLAAKAGCLHAQVAAWVLFLT